MQIAGPGILSYYGDAIIEYDGDGILFLADGSELRCEFRTGQFVDGRIVLICRILPIDIHKINLQNWIKGIIRARRLQGKTNDGKSVIATEVNYPIGCGIVEDQISAVGIFNPKSIEINIYKDLDVDGISFGITNFAFKGIPYSHPDYTEFLGLNLLGKRVVVWKPNNYSDIINYMKLNGVARITCEIWAEIGSEKDVEMMEKMITDLCYVLSVASGSKVQWIFRDLHSKELRVSTLHKLVPNKPYNSLSIIDAHGDPLVLAEFVKVAYPSYLSSIDIFGEVNGIPRITAAIDALLDSRIKTDFLQIRGVKLVTTMEIVREMLQVWMPKKKLLSKGDFKKMKREIEDALEPIFLRYLSEPDAIDAIENLFELNKPSFRSILENGLKSIKFGMNDDDISLLIKSRNSLVHQGRFYCETATPEQMIMCKPMENIQEEYEFISKSVNQIILALLSYKNGWCNLGNTYLAMDRFEDAKDAYLEAVRLDKKDALPWHGLANAYRYLGKFSKSIMAYKRAVELSKKEAGAKLITLAALNGLASLLWINGDQEGAINANNDAVKLDPLFCSAHISLAAIYRKIDQQNNFEGEIHKIKKLISNEREYNKACFEAIIGNVDEALKHLGIAINNGDEHMEWICRDPDLEFIRAIPQFKALITDLSTSRKIIINETANS